MVWILLGACTRDVAPSDKQTNTSGSSAECLSDGDCPNANICEAEECVDGDRNNSVEEAVSLLWEESVSEFINPSGDVDYFTFTARGGEYVRIATETLLEGGDTVLTLRDPTGQVVTWSDNFPTGTAVSSLDSVIYAYLAYDGDYLLTVEDAYGYYDPDEAYGRSDYAYTLSLSEWNNHTNDPDTSESANVTATVDATNLWSSIGVHIQENEDKDYIQIDYSAKTEAGEDARFLYVYGVENLDGSDLKPRVRLLDATGDVLSDAPDVGENGILAFPNMSEGTYFLEVSDALESGGDNHWTYVFLLAREYSPYPVEAELNDTMETANPIEMTPLQTDGGSDYTVGKYFGVLPSASDVDWFSIEHLYADGNIILCANSTLYGSTLSPTISLYDSSMVLVAESNSDPQADPNLTLVEQVSATGQYFFTIEGGTGQSSDWYQFLAYSTDFEPTSYSCP